MKLDMEKFRTVLKAHIKAAAKGRPNQLLLSAECGRVLSTGEYVRRKAEALASGTQENVFDVFYLMLYCISRNVLIFNYPNIIKNIL